MGGVGVRGEKAKQRERKYRCDSVDAVIDRRKFLEGKIGNE